MGSNFLESDTFNRRFVEKLSEQRDRIQRGDEVSAWQQIALELSQEWELECSDLRWQDLSLYFKRSLVFKLRNGKLTTDQGLIDRLQYPYLRKVYVMKISFYEKFGTTGKAANSTEIADDKLFIKYTLDGRFDPDVVAAFKRRSRKGKRIYVNINVEDPVYNLPNDVKQMLLHIEHRRKERSHRNVEETNERDSSPVMLDGVPTTIEDASPREKEFSARDLLEKESFSVNTQEYDDIIKESLERELPPVPKRRRVESVQPGSVEIWLASCEILSPSASMVVGQDDPLNMSTRGGTGQNSQTKHAAESSVSEPLFTPSSGEVAQASVHDQLTAVMSQPPTLLMASQPAAASQEAVQVKQEPDEKPVQITNEKASQENGFDPFKGVFTDSEDEEDEEEPILHKTDEPTLNVPSQHSTETKDVDHVKNKTVEDSKNLHMVNVFTDSSDEDDDPLTNVSPSGKSGPSENGPEFRGTILSKPTVDQQVDNEELTNVSLVSVPCQSNRCSPPAKNKSIPIAAVPQEPSQSKSPESVPVATSKVQHIPSNDEESSTDTSVASVIQVQPTGRLIQSEQSVIDPQDKSIPPIAPTTTAQPSPGPRTVLFLRNNTGHRGIPVLNNSLESVPLHCIVKQRRLPLTAPAESAVASSGVSSNDAEVSVNVSSPVADRLNISTNRRSDHSTAPFTKTLKTNEPEDRHHSMEIGEPDDLKTERYLIDLHFGSQSPNLQIYMDDLRRHRLQASIMQPSTSAPPARELSGISNLEETSDRGVISSHSSQSSESTRLVIAWSPKSTSNSSGTAPIAQPSSSPPTATSPTAPKFREEQYDSIQPVVESRLRFQAVLRSLWPELFTKDGLFCDFLHLVSVLAGNIFPRLQPTTEHAAVALQRLVTPIARRIAYGNVGPTEDRQAVVSCRCQEDVVVVEEKRSSERRNWEENSTEGDPESPTAGDKIQRISSTETDATTIPTIVLSDDEGTEVLPVRRKRKYRVHQ